jgi:hypothetical protein
MYFFKKYLVKCQIFVKHWSKSDKLLYYSLICACPFFKELCYIDTTIDRKTLSKWFKLEQEIFDQNAHSYKVTINPLIVRAMAKLIVVRTKSNYCSNKHNNNKLALARLEGPEILGYLVCTTTSTVLLLL